MKLTLVLALALLLAFFAHAQYNMNPPEVCTMPAGMSCTRFYLSEKGLNMSLVNGLQKSIVITNISCSRSTNLYESCDSERCPGYDPKLKGVQMQLGQRSDFLIRCTDETGEQIYPRSDDSFSGKINVVYYFKDEGPNAQRRIVGNIFAKSSGSYGHPIAGKPAQEEDNTLVTVIAALWIAVLAAAAIYLAKRKRT